MAVSGPPVKKMRPISSYFHIKRSQLAVEESKHLGVEPTMKIPASIITEHEAAPSSPVPVVTDVEAIPSSLVPIITGVEPAMDIPVPIVPETEHLDDLSLGVETESSFPSVIIIERDPGKRRKISEHPVNQRDEIRRAYINVGAFQPKLANYRAKKIGGQNRQFQYAWFKTFPWLEYSPTTHKAYYFPCFLFLNDSNACAISTLVTDGFDNWKRVKNENQCAFLAHVGSTPTSTHHQSVRSVEDLMKTSRHGDNLLQAQTKEEVEKRRLRIKTTIRGVRFLALQGCAFRGNDESPESSNRGNFIQFVKSQAEVSEEIAKVVLHNAPQNCTYTSHHIQKEILHIMGDRVRKMIREEVGDNSFCILVDEAQDESKREQMAIILRFVNNDGMIVERFFAIKAVKDTTSSTLKKEIYGILAHYNLAVDKMRGQAYDGANNMRGCWNGLQALFLKDCPYAYYVHCFAHRLQLTLVSAAKDVSVIWRFFSQLEKVVNVVSSSPKRISELQAAQREEIRRMVASGERETGKGANQIGTLQRPGTTCWSSHFKSVKTLIDMYAATCQVLENISDNYENSSFRSEADGVYTVITRFEFVFVLLLMDKLMGITEVLCQALQNKSQDILNAVRLVFSTKTLLQSLRADGWKDFLENVKTFCLRHHVDMPDLDSVYKVGLSNRNREQITVEHHYHFDVFNSSIDFQLMELNTRFNETSMELLTLSTALDPKNCFESFNTKDIHKLASKFYLGDFNEQDLHYLGCELQHYQIDVVGDSRFQQISTLSELCRELVATRKSDIYVMIIRLIRLVLTLPVSTASAERAFSAMNLIKTSLRNKMGDDFLADCLELYIERDLTESIGLESVIDESFIVKTRRIQSR